METPSQPEPGNWARRFFTIWTGQALSLFGSALVQFALIWWLTQKSGSATVLAIAVLVGMLRSDRHRSLCRRWWTAGIAAPS